MSCRCCGCSHKLRSRWCQRCCRLTDAEREVLSARLMDDDDWAVLRAAELKSTGETVMIVSLWRQQPNGESVIYRLGVRRASGVVEWAP